MRDIVEAVISRKSEIIGKNLVKSWYVEFSCSFLRPDKVSRLRISHTYLFNVPCNLVDLVRCVKVH